MNSRPASALVLALLLAVPPVSRADDEAPPAPARRLLVGADPEVRAKAFRDGGGSEEARKAIDAGLDWLLRHRVEGGGWDADGFPDRCAKDGEKCDGLGRGHHGEEVPCPFDDALSAMAVLAFLGHGVVPDPEGPPAARAVDEALSGLRGARDPWARALSTQAFAEAECLEGKGRWKDDVAAGAEHLLETRGKDGAWGYIAGFRKGSDVPYTAFAVQALVAARDAGVKLPADLPKGVDAYLDTLEEEKGKLAYLVDGRRYGYTPTSQNAHNAAAIRELLEVGRDGMRHRLHLALVATRKPEWKISFREVDVPGRGRQKVQMGNLSLYQWWYGTLASFQRGGTAWSGWRGALESALIPHQVKKGCAAGSWDPVGLYERTVGGRIMSTALAILMLEEPERHRRL